MRTNRLLVALGLALALIAVNAAADDDVANGRKLYLGQPSASHPSGSVGCNGCHNVNDTSTEQNTLFRGASGDPALIDFAINSNPASTDDMRPLYGAGAPSELSGSDMSDLAAYINSVVNPGGGLPPTFKASPASGNFGSVSVGLQSAPMSFTLSNSGSTGTLMSVSSSNNTEFLLAGGTCLATPVGLVRNGSCTLRVIFAPSVTGAGSSTITVINNGSPNPLVIKLTGTGGDGGSGGGVGTKVRVVEYYDAGINHYFITPIDGEIALLGKPPFDAWQPTGLAFNAFTPGGAPAGTVGICRFFNDHFLDVSTHFYAPHGAGCETTIAQFPDWTLESAQLFNAYVPDLSGNCAAGSVPVYRLFNNGQGGAPNHRFTTNLAVRQSMLDQGYTAEGFGIGVGMCVPQ